MSAAADLRCSERLGSATASPARLSRGLGRSYGDAALPPEVGARLVGTTLADRMLAFDSASGLFTAEAGLSLAELARVMMPRGWFTPVSPGTKFVTLGGMVASDVHGKNHHVAGCFGEHVESLRLRVADGRVVDCSLEREPELFLATLGGMGLTGHILEVTFRLVRIPSPWLVAENRRVANVEEFLSRLEEASSEWPMTVGWIDCTTRGARLGRGLLMSGRWAEASEAPTHPPRSPKARRVPWDAPGWLLSPVTTRLANALYYRKQLRRVRRGIVDPDHFFYPLDAVHDWNRLYGRRGMTQHQCVLPKETLPGSARALLEIVARHGAASPLCVIKDCGAEGRGMLSFPKPGISVALDLPVRDNTQAVIDEINELVSASGGRIYLTKDSFTRREHFRAMEPRLAAFQEVRRRWDPDGRFESALSRRLLGDEP